MSYTVKSLVYTEMEHTFSDDGQWLASRVVKGWQTVPSGTRPQKPKTREIETKLGETITL
jgi:hypothetical protein